jgi:hypothetical protein
MGRSDERRTHARYRTWLPAQIAGEAVEVQLAIGHDMSQKGALLVTREELAKGARITLEVQVPPNDGERYELTGTVLRSEPNHADPDGLWPHQIAVEFDEAMPELEEALEDHFDNLAAMDQEHPAADIDPPTRDETEDEDE